MWWILSHFLSTLAFPGEHLFPLVLGAQVKADSVLAPLQGDFTCYFSAITGILGKLGYFYACQAWGKCVRMCQVHPVRHTTPLLSHNTGLRGRSGNTRGLFLPGLFHFGKGMSDCLFFEFSVTSKPRCPLPPAAPTHCPCRTRHSPWPGLGQNLFLISSLYFPFICPSS